MHLGQEALVPEHGVTMLWPELVYKRVVYFNFRKPVFNTVKLVLPLIVSSSAHTAC